MARPNPFSIYASQFINNASTAINKSIYPESETPEPLFFSVTEGSHLAQSKDSILHQRPRDDAEGSDVDDDGYPKLSGSRGDILKEDYDNDQYAAGPSSSSHHNARSPRKLSDDPYLDDTELEEEYGLHEDVDAIPLIASGTRSPIRPSPAPAPGWLAHFSVSRHNSPLPPKQQSSRSSSSDSLSSQSTSRRTSDDSTDPPPFLDREAPSSPPTRTTLSESLLPRDGVSRSLFTLPEPGRVPRRKYNDSAWTVLWCTALLLCAVGSVVILFVTTSPTGPSTPERPPTPYFTISHAVPLLTLVTLFSSVLSYAHLILLRYAVRPVLMGTALTVPLSLFVGAAWSFSGSFLYEDGMEPTWGETVGLRIFSLVPLALSVISARSLYHRRKALLRTVAVVEISTSVILEHPPVLGLSLCLLLGGLIASLPFLSLILRLTLIGYYSPSHGHQEWHLRGYAGWLAVLVTGVWVWSWSVIRGALRVSVSGVIGNWYFNRLESLQSRPDPLAATHAAFARAHGASLGSICVATLVLTVTQLSIFVLRTLRRMSTPPQLSFLAPLHPLELILGLIGIFESLSSHTLTYIGLTGEGFWPGSRRAKELLSSGGKMGRAKGSRSGDYALLSYLLILSSLSIALVAAVGGYIFAAHSLHGPGNAFLMALLTGGVTFMTVKFGVGVGEDAADALFLCHKLDLAAGTEHSQEVYEAFEGKRQPNPNEP
ncbi:hypothetical protein FRB95_009225 [Tulasnella sp. JGI-2019a]|nr:hypothetical protein FRB95_009225 [Tulasnella sp. JGI-2019a]